MGDAYAQHEANKAAMSEIDKGLDALVAQAAQINTGAKAIGQELDEQIEMNKDLSAHMDRTDAGINKATDKVHEVGQTSSGSIVSWICMILLVILIIVIAVLPKSVFGR
jgi:hypothetical protein